MKMLERCYSDVFAARYPSYKGCYVVAEWHSFMGFRSWMIGQDWVGKQLDKDLIANGNKEYGPDTCVFVTKQVNVFVTDSAAARGPYPIGVTFNKVSKKFQAKCCDGQGKILHLGHFDTPESAHEAWRSRKKEIAHLLASKEKDPRISQALLNRYSRTAKPEVDHE